MATKLTDEEKNTRIYALQNLAATPYTYAYPCRGELCSPATNGFNPTKAQPSILVGAGLVPVRDEGFKTHVGTTANPCRVAPACATNKAMFEPHAGTISNAEVASSLVFGLDSHLLG